MASAHSRSLFEPLFPKVGSRRRHTVRNPAQSAIECLEARALITSLALARDFGENGITISSFADEELDAASTRDDQGRLLVLETARNGAGSFNRDFVVSRYSSGGQLDATFGTNGRTIIDFGSDDRARGIVVDHQGRVVVVGVRPSGLSFAGAILVARLTPDGQLDPSFDTDGKVARSTGTTSQWAATAVAVQDDDRILISGFTREIFDNTIWDLVASRYLVMRLTTTGAFDLTFGEQIGGSTSNQRSGLRRTASQGRPGPYRNDRNYGYGLAIDPRDQSIIQVGEADGERAAILKYDRDGTLLMYRQSDELTSGLLDGRAEDVVLGPTGDVIVTGQEGSSSFVEFLNSSLERTSLFRYRDIGPELGGTVGLNALAMQFDGSVVASGVFRGANSNQLLVSRFTALHEPDELFAEHGTFILPPTRLAPQLPLGGQFGSASGGGVIVQDSGRIVVTGTVPATVGRDVFLVGLDRRQSRQEFHRELEWLAKDLVYRPDWELGDDVMFGYSVDAIWNDPTTGLYGFGLTSGDTDQPPVLVIRGTEASNDIFDVLDDLNPEGIGYGQFQSAKTLDGLRRPINELDPIESTTMFEWLQSVTARGAPVITGHSLGGAVTQWLAAYYTGTLALPLGEVVTFNSPGIDSDAASDFFPGLVEAGVTHYVVQGDIVSMGGERFIFGEVRFASFAAQAALASDIIGAKHLRPILANGLGGRSIPAGLMLAETQSTSWLNSSYFFFADPEYLLVIAELSIALGAVSGNPAGALLPLNALLRGTAEPTRQQIGEQIRPIVDKLQIATANPGLQVALPDYRFQLPGLIEIDTSGLSVRYLGGSNNTIRFVGQSEIHVGGLPTVTADFSGDRFLEVTTSGIRGIAELGVQNLVIVPEELVIDSASLLVDTVNRRLAGSATVTIPPGIDVSGSLEFTGNRLSSVGLSVSGLSIPIPIPEPPVFFVTQLGASVANLDHPDPFPAIGGSIGVSIGPGVRIPLPQWLGGGTTVELASLDGMAMIAPEALTGRLGVNLLNGWLTSSAGTFSETTWNWAQGRIQLDGQVEVMGPFGFSATGQVQTAINSRLSVDSHGTVSFRLPNQPGTFFRGQQIPVAELTGQYRHNLDLRDDFFLVQSTLRIGNKVSVRVGAKISLDGLIRMQGFQLLPPVVTPQAISLRVPTPQISSLLQSNVPNPVETSFVVSTATDTLLLVLDWQHDVGDVPLELIDPQGAVYDEAAIAASTQIELLSDLSGPTGRVLAVANAGSGTWRVRLHPSQNLGLVTSNAYATDTPSTLAIDTAQLDANRLTVGYRATDPDAAERIEFYLDTDNSGTDGILIGTATEQDGAGSFTWLNKSVPGGRYFVYAVINSASNLPAVSYSTASINLPDPQIDVAVTAVENDSLSWQVIDGELQLIRNGRLDEAFTPVPARFVRSLLVTGGDADNRLDLSAITQRQFPAATGVTVTGEAGHDTLIGSELADILWGGVGNDQIIGGAGNNTVIAGSGNDSITGGPGADSISANDGFDTVFGGTGNDTIDGGAGNDQINGQDNDDSIIGGTGNDTLIGGLGNDVFRDVAYTDVVAGQTRTITLTDTSLVVKQGTTTLSTDALSGFEFADLTGGAMRDFISASTFTNTGVTTINGGGGNDVISGTEGADVIFTLTGADSINGNGGADAILSGSGNDTVNGGEGADNLNGQSGNDSLVGDNGNDVLVGGAGIDTMSGGLGNDFLSGQTEAGLLSGGEGNDTLQGNTSNDTLQGDAGDDRLFGLQGNDVISGGDGADSLLGGSGNDSMEGAAGNDTLQGDIGNDTLNGGTETDRINEVLDTNITITATNLNSGMGVDTYSGIERIQLSGGVSNNLFDARLATVPLLLAGGAGNDTLLGGSKGDGIAGGEGDDVISGGAGVDIIDGGNGNDFWLESADTNFTVNGVTVSSATTGTETGVSIERIALIGGVGANKLDASLATVSVVLIGGRGNDTLLGGNAADTLTGGNRNDATVVGGDGVDSLDGGAGNDTLENDPVDTKITAAGDTTIADVFALLPSWIDAL